MLNAILMSLSSCSGFSVVRRWIAVLSQIKKPQLLIVFYLAANSNYEDVLYMIASTVQMQCHFTF